METNNNGNKISEFTIAIRGFMSTSILFIAFTFGLVRRLDINSKHIYLWQNAKGEVHYCFNLFEKEYYTTSVIKLGNVLTQHFGHEVEVVNNNKEYLKKIINATSAQNKALTDANKYDEYKNYSSQNQLPYILNHSGNIIQTEEELFSSQNNTHLELQQIPSQQHPFRNQETLYENAIQLSTYYLESHINTIYIKLNELPIIHKEVFAPNTKTESFTSNNGLNYKNKFVPTELMVYHLGSPNVSESFIMVFILFMAKNNIHQALKIIVWIADSFAFLNKVPFALVLHSQSDIYMKILYEEILEPLFHDFQCEKIENNSLNPKSLANILDEKIIYNFDNIVTPTILGEKAYEFTNKLIHKESVKINKNSITTVANVLITSTSKYIPMISQDVPTATVETDSSINELCKHFNVRPNRNIINNYIKNDLANFVSILRSIDIRMLNKTYPIIDNSIDDNLLSGDDDITKVFDSIIRAKDITPFKAMAMTNKYQKLVNELEDNFKRNRVDKAHLLDYFEMLFGKGIYRSNTAFIGVLRKDYSNSGEPFDDYKTHVRNGRGYYILKNSEATK